MKKLVIHSQWDTSPHDGCFFVEFKGYYFPEFEWFDIPSSILCMWLKSVSDFISQNYHAPCLLFFMDGPYRMELSFNAFSKYILSLHSGSTIVQCGEIDFTLFVDDLIEQAQRLLVFYKKHALSYSSYEYREIESRLSGLLLRRLQL